MKMVIFIIIIIIIIDKLGYPDLFEYPTILSCKPRIS